MMSHRKSYKAALFTFAIFGAVGGVGLANTLRWYSALPAEMAATPLPVSFHLSVAQLAFQFLGSALAAGFILFGSPRISRLIAITVMVGLLVVHFSGWPAAHTKAIAMDSLLLTDGIRLAIALWLAYVLIGLASNNSFKPRPLRGSA